MKKRPRTRTTVFWGVFAAAKKKYQEAGFSPDDIEAERQELIKLAGGRPDENGRYSITRLDNEQFNKLLDLVERMVLGKKEGPTRRARSYIYAIKKLGYPDEKLNEIARDQFRCSDWQTLPAEKLFLLRKTAVARTYQPRR